ncbi:TetR/AcrR family transcriptional regulator [Neotabrizicola shimadae]|uniref:TetR family transcriptional regulator C-terminal domain-containing protein n=1 Tax=Neotabrizicola shimadae TaxID=2807096 RepID=A0A8G0ZZA5_9RHOB|nr:TetR family transcriptional regulator C-terminal domain-containing protein [Neotabrizicola shimadae]QYZ71775.1 TetR family transcriptional regulator C-terminal domain-containing protein [Neotabrizicola shimadae]
MSDGAAPGPRFRRLGREVRAAMLVEAGMQVLAEGGIRAFTIDNICKVSGASRGLVTHHFGGKDGLLAKVYEAVYRPLLDAISPPDAAPPHLPELLDHLFSPANYSRDTLNVWLAIWSEIATGGTLRDEHRTLYARYRAVVSEAVARHAAANGRKVNADAMAMTLIALVDGLWLELCLDPSGLTPEGAKAACLDLLEPVLGPIGDQT